jgi:hypothetical protein
MTWYAAVLFSHIAGALFLFAGLVLEWLAISNGGRVVVRAHSELWTHLVCLAPKLYLPALVVVFFSGRYLAERVGWEQTWILAALAGLVAIGLIWLIFTRPRVKAIQKIASGGESGFLVLLRERLNDPLLLASVGMRVALVFGILLLMVTKLDSMLSVFIMVGGVGLGTLLAASCWWRARTQEVL